MELDKVTLPVVLRNLHEYDNQLSDACTGFDHRFLRVALRGGDSIRPSAGQPFDRAVSRIDSGRFPIFEASYS